MITPIHWLVRTISDWFITMIVGSERSAGNIVTEDMVRTLVQEAVGEGTLDHAEAQFIDHIFDFGNKAVKVLMTSRTDVAFRPIDATGPDILDIFKQNRQSRMPVYEGHRDDIVGVLHARDLLHIDIGGFRFWAARIENNRILEVIVKPLSAAALSEVDISGSTEPSASPYKAQTRGL